MKIRQPFNKELIRKDHCLSRAEIYHLSNEELLGDFFFFAQTKNIQNNILNMQY